MMPSSFNNNTIFLSFPTHFKSSSSTAVDEDDNGEFGVERVKALRRTIVVFNLLCSLNNSPLSGTKCVFQNQDLQMFGFKLKYE